MPRLALNRKSGIRLAPEAVSQGWIAFPGLAPPGLDAIARVVERGGRGQPVALGLSVHAGPRWEQVQRSPHGQMVHGKQ
jgi:hypothetical protein